MTDKQTGLGVVVLKPCPFCGAVAVNVRQSGKFTHYAECYGGCRGPKSSSAKEAIAAWNRRSCIEPVSAEPVADTSGWGELLAGYQRICAEHGIEPTSKDVLAAMKRHDANEPIKEQKPFCYTASINIGPYPTIASYFREGIYDFPLYTHSSHEEQKAVEVTDAMVERAHFELRSRGYHRLTDQDVHLALTAAMRA